VKYDRPIPAVRGQEEGLAKGYYYFDADLMKIIREKVLGAAASRAAQPLRTIECSIMDTADDIAYSTFDLEDAFKSGLWTPIGMWHLSQQRKVMDEIVARIDAKITDIYGEHDKFTTDEAQDLMTAFFQPLFEDHRSGPEDTEEEMSDLWKSGTASRRLAQDGYLRTELTSGLISKALNNLQLVISPIHPALDTVRLALKKFKEIEVLKGLNFAAVISSPIMKTVEYKGGKIIEELFAILSTPSGSKLLPDDFKFLYENVPDPSLKKRVICDFIAGMTDRYALEFYDRLVSARPAGIYRPHH
jgi:dGTPase